MVYFYPRNCQQGNYRRYDWTQDTSASVSGGVGNGDRTGDDLMREETRATERAEIERRKGRGR